MTVLRAIIVDDEELARDFLASILSETPELEVIARCKSGREAIKKTQELEPDLLFLDIHMPGLSGFDTVRSLQADAMPMVIFATAYDQYAVEAFELHAVDYILKPFEPERVKLAVERALERKRLELASDSKGQLMGAIETVGSKDAPGATPHNEPIPAKKLAITDGSETFLVCIDDIDWVDAAGDYMCVHVGSKTHVMRATMKELEEKLAASSLERVHRSTLANLDRVDSISSLPKGECLLHMQNGATLKVSRSYSNRVKFLRQ
ncbi:MAG: LytR/AlgR family response regulator transcription factor [bacterium]